jgi:hypothetical protein
MPLTFFLSYFFFIYNLQPAAIYTLPSTFFPRVAHVLRSLILLDIFDLCILSVSFFSLSVFGFSLSSPLSLPFSLSLSFFLFLSHGTQD